MHSRLSRAHAAIVIGVLVLAVGVARPAEVRAQSTDGLPRPALLERALAAYHRVESAGLLRTRLLTVIDYSLPSWERRLWVVEPLAGASSIQRDAGDGHGPAADDVMRPMRLRVVFHEFVAHGRGSASDDDPDHAVRFGNDAASLRSSLGTFVTGSTYTGKHGRSLELIGLDPGVNDNALERRIVMHPADYVSAEFRAIRGGRVGRSWGCPALDPAVAPALIDRIREGSVLFVDGAPATAVGPAQLAAAARAQRR